MKIWTDQPGDFLGEVDLTEMIIKRKLLRESRESKEKLVKIGNLFIDD